MCAPIASRFCRASQQIVTGVRHSMVQYSWSQTISESQHSKSRRQAARLYATVGFEISNHASAFGCGASQSVVGRWSTPPLHPACTIHVLAGWALLVGSPPRCAPRDHRASPCRHLGRPSWPRPVRPQSSVLPGSSASLLPARTAGRNCYVTQACTRAWRS